MFAVLLGIVIVGASPIFFAEQDAAENTEIDGIEEPKLNAAVGVVLIFAAQIFSALQFVVEEKACIVSHHNHRCFSADAYWI